MLALLIEQANEDGDTSKTYRQFVVYYVVSSVIAVILCFHLCFDWFMGFLTQPNYFGV
jgi:hypothetical protein